MSDLSPILSLPYLLPSQAQKHVTHNEALQLLDALVQLRVIAFDAETPPLDPSPGASYALGDTPTAAWSGWSQHLAIWQGEGWLFVMPLPGWRAWGEDTEELRVWQGSSWELPPSETQNLDHIGINSSADASNRLTIAADASLFTHDGAGHQMKLNKSASGQTAALLFQSNWNGRAELGLLGSNDCSIKTSSGGSWQNSLVLKANGSAGLGTTSPSAHLEIAGSGQDYLLAGAGAGAGGGAMFRLAADGNGSCDGAWSGGGADYAEWFEWQDGNPLHEDRRGLSVVLEGARIRPARAGEDPIGVISAAPAVIGDGDMGHWKGRWQRDAFGAVLRDPDEEPLQDPAYDPNRPYQPRSTRPEWDLVGLMGKLRLRPDQSKGARWIFMRSLSDQIEEWLIR
jgi:Protein of unknown function (DUF2793)/Peptidase_G2, IMC autoproteolytic cleavage domain